MSLRVCTNLRVHIANDIIAYGRRDYITTGQVWIIVYAPVEA